MSMERATAKLLRGGDHFAAIPCEDFCRVTVDIAEYQVLCAAGEERDTVLLAACGRRQRSNQIGRKLWLDVRRQGFEFTQPSGEQLQYAAAPDERLEA